MVPAACFRGEGVGEGDCGGGVGVWAGSGSCGEFKSISNAPHGGYAA